MNLEEQQFTDKVAALCCVICRNEGLADDSPAVIHHVVECKKRKGWKYILPLCPAHHDGSGRGISRHPFKQAWEAAFGTERELVEQTWRDVGYKGKWNE